MNLGYAILYKHAIVAAVWFIIIMIYAFSERYNKEAAMLAGLWLFTALHVLTCLVMAVVNFIMGNSAAGKANLIAMALAALSPFVFYTLGSYLLRWFGK